MLFQTGQRGADSVTVALAGPVYMKAGCVYALKIRQAQTANLYDQAPATTGCGSALNPPTDIISATTCLTGPSPGLLYTGEAAAPTVSSIQVHRLDGTLAAAGGVTDAFGGTAIRITFNEPVDPATVTDTTITLSGNPARSYLVEGSGVTVTPAARLTAGTSYTVGVGAVKDLAGNSHGTASAAFTVETVVATFDAVAHDAAVGRSAPFGAVVLTFSEAMDPATVGVNQNGGVRGSISVADNAGALLFGTAAIDAVDPKKVRWYPEASVSGKSLVITANHAAAPSKITDLAGTQVATTQRTLNVP